MNLKSFIFLVLRIAAAVILLQTLFFKFSAHPESVELFSKLGIEPWGRIGTGVLELATSMLLLIPSTVFLGAVLGVGLMGGAIFAHLFIIGIESKGDGGQLFFLAILVFSCCLVLAITKKESGITFYNRFFK